MLALKASISLSTGSDSVICAASAKKSGSSASAQVSSHSARKRGARYRRAPTDLLAYCSSATSRDNISRPQRRQAKIATPRSTGRAVLSCPMPDGRLADPDRTLGTDPRSDPRMVAAFAPFGLDSPLPPPPLTVDSTLDERLALFAAMEEEFGAIFDTLAQSAPIAEGVTSTTVTITGGGGNDLTLYISRPADSDGPLPGVVHLHGGGMAILSAVESVYVRWRENLGLLGEYDSPADLAYKVRGAVEDDVTQMGLGSPSIRRRDAEHAMPRARRDGDSLLIENKSKSVTAEQFRFIFEGVWPTGFGGGGGEPVDLFYDGEPVDLLPDSDMRWSMAVFMQSPPQLKLTMRWMEDGEPQDEVTQIVPL